jgi:signal recognition particle subunit SRP54
MKGLEGIRQAVAKLLRGAGPYEKAVNEFIRDLQRALLRADVNVRLVFELTKRIRERALKEPPPPGASRREWLVKIAYEELVKLFGGDREPEVRPPYTPYVIMLVGVQGSGKTTTAAKLAKFYRDMGYRVGLVQTDTYRPGAYEQLKQLADRIGAAFYGDPRGGDPITIAKRGVQELKSRGVDIIVVDTAGRHGYGSERALLDEMREMANAIAPDEVILVVDATIGQKSYELAKRFNEATPIGSIIVTKMDGTAKGGGALSAIAATGAVIKFIGTGEDIDEFEVFKPRRFIARVMGIGDLETLLEKLEKYVEASKLEETVAEMLSGRLTLRLIYRQLQQLRKLGPFRKILQMLPGSYAIEALDEAAKLGEEKIKKWLNIMNSMTYEELDRPEIIDRSRMKRIAVGSGTEVSDVKELLNYYRTLQRMLKQMKRRKDLIEKLMQKFGKV